MNWWAEKGVLLSAAPAQPSWAESAQVKEPGRGALRDLEMVLATVLANAAEVGLKAEVVGAVVVVVIASGAGPEAHCEGAAGRALVREERLVFDPPDVTLVLTPFKRAV
jgi:hypothetical protein